MKRFFKILGVVAVLCLIGLLINSITYKNQWQKEQLRADDLIRQIEYTKDVRPNPPICFARFKDSIATVPCESLENSTGTFAVIIGHKEEEK